MPGDFYSNIIGARQGNYSFEHGKCTFLKVVFDRYLISLFNVRPRFAWRPCYLWYMPNMWFAAIMHYGITLTSWKSCVAQQ